LKPLIAIQHMLMLRLNIDIVTLSEVPPPGPLVRRRDSNANSTSIEVTNKANAQPSIGRATKTPKWPRPKGSEEPARPDFHDQSY